MAEVAHKPSLSLIRRFNAPPETVWRAWTEPEALKHWMAPTDRHAVELAETDVRVGGRYRLVMKAPDGELHDVSGVYREVIPNRKLVYTWAWKSTPERESLVTVQLRATTEGTELTLTHEAFVDEAVRDRHQHGWSGCLDQLERFLG